MDAHELVSRLKDLAVELGRVPTRDEFRRHVPEKVITEFGGFIALKHAAGFTSGRKIDSSVFERDLERHLEAHRPREIIKQEPYKRTLAVGDIHFPFAHKPTLEKIYRFAEENDPEIVVQVGDLYDSYSNAKFPRSHNVFTPREEHTVARKQAEEFWREIKRVAPRAACFQVIGNHDVRPLKRILEVYPEAEDWISRMVTEMMSFDGVETVKDTRTELMLPGDVMVIHGYRSKIGEHRDYALHNAIVGHQHVGGVVYRQIRGRVLWEMNAGLVGDPEAKGLTYTPQRINNWTLGWGWLDEYGPRFIPA